MVARFSLYERFPTNPIIKPGMDGLEGDLGKNINGPSLIKVPEWVRNSFAKYYLYFAHHGGKYVRLAYSDSLEGPWKIYNSGVLHLDQTCCEKHVASPDVLIDDDKKEIRLYFHGCYRSDNYKGHNQLTFVATSKDGITFQVQPQVLGPFYFRVFKYKGDYYGIAKNRNEGGLLLKSPDGISPFTIGKEFIKRMRHAAVLLENDDLYVFYSRIGDKPERILLSHVDLTDDWLAWKPSTPMELLHSEEDYEGVEYPLEESRSGSMYKPVHQLRDPAIYTEKGNIYLFYSVQGEKGIAGALLRKQE